LRSAYLGQDAILDHRVIAPANVFILYLPLKTL
jgi:hypothetical protein